MLERSTILEILAQAKTAPICHPGPPEETPAFAYTGLTARQALTLQMRHYVLKMNGADPTQEVLDRVAVYKHTNSVRFGNAF